MKATVGREYRNKAGHRDRGGKINRGEGMMPRGSRHCIGKTGAGILTVRFTYRDQIRIFGAGYWRKGKKIKHEASRHHTAYQKMIRNLLDAYAVQHK
jgi:hypothetical protein